MENTKTKLNRLEDFEKHQGHLDYFAMRKDLVLRSADAITVPRRNEPSIKPVIDTYVVTGDCLVKEGISYEPKEILQGKDWYVKK